MEMEFSLEKVNVIILLINISIFRRLNNVMKKIRKILLLYFFLISHLSATNYIKFKFDDKYGLLDEKGKIVCKGIYSNISFINNYIFLNTGEYIEIRNNDFKILDIVASDKAEFFTKVNYLTKDFYAFHGYKRDCIYNLANKNFFFIEKIASNLKDDDITFIIPIYTGGYYYSLIEHEKYLDNFNFEKVFPFVDDVAVVLQGNWEKAVIDKTGKIIINHLVNCGWQYEDGLLPVITKEESGFINKYGDFIIKCDIFDELKTENPGGNPTLFCIYSEGLAYVRTSKSKHMLINKSGKIIKKDLPYFSDSRIGFSNGLIPVYLNGKCGYLTSEGNIFGDLVFDSVEDFITGYACVIYKGQDGVIDKNGNLYLSKDLLLGKLEAIANILVQ